MIKKHILFISSFFAGCYSALSCPECDRNQPELLKGITHGEGPTGTVDYIILWTAVIIVSISLILSIKYLVRPKEDNKDHIKNIILNKYF